MHLFGDEPQEVTYFLRAIYDSRYVVVPSYLKHVYTQTQLVPNKSFFEPPPTLTNIQTIAGILRLSTKYDVEYLRRRALKHLDALYPSSLEAFDKRQDTRTTPWRDNTAFYVASLARELGLEWLMPPVLYCVCSCPAGDIVDGYIWNDHLDQEDIDDAKDGEGKEEEKGKEKENKEKWKKRIKLDKEDRGRCVRALIDLGNREKRDLLCFLTVDRVLGCEMPDECRKGRVEMLRMVDGSRDYLDPLGAMDTRWGWYAKCVCKVCAEEGRRAHDEERGRFWDALPRIFGLKNWDVLQDLKWEALYGGDSNS